MDGSAARVPRKYPGLVANSTRKAGEPRRGGARRSGDLDQRMHPCLGGVPRVTRRLAARRPARPKKASRIAAGRVLSRTGSGGAASPCQFLVTDRASGRRKFWLLRRVRHRRGRGRRRCRSTRWRQLMQRLYSMGSIVCRIRSRAHRTVATRQFSADRVRSSGDALLPERAAQHSRRLERVVIPMELWILRPATASKVSICRPAITRLCRSNLHVTDRYHRARSVLRSSYLGDSTPGRPCPGLFRGAGTGSAGAGFEPERHDNVSTSGATDGWWWAGVER